MKKLLSYVPTFVLGLIGLYFIHEIEQGNTDFIFATLAAVAAALYCLPGDRNFYTDRWTWLTVPRLIGSAIPEGEFTKKELKSLFDIQCGVVFFFAAGMVLVVAARNFDWPFLPVAAPVAILETVAIWLLLRFGWIILGVWRRWQQSSR